MVSSQIRGNCLEAVPLALFDDCGQKLAQAFIDCPNNRPDRIDLDLLSLAHRDLLDTIRRVHRGEKVLSPDLG